MNEDLQFILDTAKESMENALKHLEKQLTNIRAGKASPAMLGSVMVDYYGSQTPLGQVWKNYYCATLGKKYATGN
jgi:ribosome recycling factor